jgi:hypothetical protein
MNLNPEPGQRAGLSSFQENQMSIPHFARTNFNTLLQAAADGNLALMECTDAITHVPRFVICAIGRDNGDHVFTPFGHLAEGNPFEAYVPPETSNAEGSAAPS